MNYIQVFFIRYFVLLCIDAVLLITSIQNYRKHKTISLSIILIIFTVLLLAVCDVAEDYSKDVIANIPLATLFAFVGYISRPICIFLFILMCGISLNKKQLLISLVPIFVNIVIYSLAFFPGTKNHVFYFIINESGTLSFQSGGFLRYSSHIISFGYLLWLTFLSIKSIRLKHLSHSFAILTCAIFVVLAVIVETFFNNGGDVHLLNTTIVVSALQYYLFLYTERSQIDGLTGLFNRETYFNDLNKMDKSITGIVQFDMNGLKYINDNFGHEEGDRALSMIADMIHKSSTKGMYAYRIGGDEFILLAIDCSEDELNNTIKQFNDLIAQTMYYCSVGYAYRHDDNISAKDLVKVAETKMYEAKDLFYKNSPFERRVSR